ncbi:MAG: hypothetical protein KJO91_06625 [Gammaproteobacteria bacterium]|nr:hypothetical protein [Gammaproteobacteria bacterium]
MAEHVRRRQHEDHTFGSNGDNDIFNGHIETDRTVTVSHGPYLERLPVANMSVGDIRERFSDRLDIDPLSLAVVDGQEVDANTIVKVGQHITFVRKAGEKGRHLFRRAIRAASTRSLKNGSKEASRIR